MRHREAIALDVGIVVSRKLFDGGVQRVHSPKHGRPRPHDIAAGDALDRQAAGNFLAIS